LTNGDLRKNNHIENHRPRALSDKDEKHFELTKVEKVPMNYPKPKPRISSLHRKAVALRKPAQKEVFEFQILKFVKQYF